MLTHSPFFHPDQPLVLNYLLLGSSWYLQTVKALTRKPKTKHFHACTHRRRAFSSDVASLFASEAEWWVSTVCLMMALLAAPEADAYLTSSLILLSRAFPPVISFSTLISSPSQPFPNWWKWITLLRIESVSLPLEGYLFRSAILHCPPFTNFFFFPVMS